MKQLFTIGYEGAVLEDFLITLDKATNDSGLFGRNLSSIFVPIVAVRTSFGKNARGNKGEGTGAGQNAVMSLFQNVNTSM